MCHIKFQRNTISSVRGHKSWQNENPHLSTSSYQYVFTYLISRNFIKSMHKCRSYGQDKLNLWLLYHLPFKCDLDLQPTWTSVSNGTSTHQGEQLCQIILKPMHKCRSYSPDKPGQMDAHMHAQYMHIHQTEIVTTMSRSPQVGSTKIQQWAGLEILLQTNSETCPAGKGSKKFTCLLKI